MKKQIKTIAKIAAANLAGFTLNAQTLAPITSGFAVACIETQNSFGKSGLENVVKYVNEHPEVAAVGGWYDTESKQFYYDATMIFSDRQKAIEAGRKNKQLAIFDLNNLQEIRL